MRRLFIARLLSGTLLSVTTFCSAALADPGWWDVPQNALNNEEATSQNVNVIGPNITGKVTFSSARVSSRTNRKSRIKPAISAFAVSRLSRLREVNIALPVRKSIIFATTRSILPPSMIKGKAADQAITSAQPDIPKNTPIVTAAIIPSSVKVRVDKVEAKSISTALLSGTKEESVKPAPLKIVPTLKVSVNLSSQRMSVYADGKLKYRWPVSSGKRGYRTPNGAFKPTWMNSMHYSRQWGYAPMPYSIFFHNGVAIHGTNHVRALGRPASHGCVRLRTSNARKLFRLVRKHSKAATKITVVGKSPTYRRRVKKRTASRAKRRVQHRTRNTSYTRVARLAKKQKRRKRVKRQRRRKKVYWPF